MYIVQEMIGICFFCFTLQFPQIINIGNGADFQTPFPTLISLLMLSCLFWFVVINTKLPSTITIVYLMRQNKISTISKQNKKCQEQVY